MSRIPIHPGEVLAEDLEALDMSAAELARQLKVPTNRITGIRNGQRAITGDTALRLAHFFGTSAQFWLNLQGLYELRVAKEKTGSAIKKLPLYGFQHIDDSLGCWDETIVLPQSRIGQVAAIARRFGERWYVFVLNGDAAGGLSFQDLPLSFLGDRPYNGTLIGDATKTTFDRRQVNGLRRTDTIDVSMLPGGGFTAVFVPAPDPSRNVGQGFSSIPPANTGAGWQAGYGCRRP